MPWTSTTTRATGFLVTAAVWNAEIVANMEFLEEVSYTQFTSDVSITATTEAAAQDVVSSGAIDYEAVPHLFEFYAPRITIGASTFNLLLQDGATVLGRFINSTVIVHGVQVSRRFTPTAASHTFKVTAHNASAATNTVNAGAGGAATFLPGFLRITKIPT